ncbi:MAG: anti-sigma factor antagonist [Candidatus Eremiobacteraeota bacterium]|nr:anti-sigma factor antagonist [Candidatus Eremiobacteraeota bacterium]
MTDTEAIKIVQFKGELEIGRKGEIHDALAAVHDARAILVDLAEVSYADSIALTELLRFCVKAQREERPVALLIQTPQFARLIQYAGLASSFKVFAQNAEALEYLQTSIRS